MVTISEYIPILFYLNSQFVWFPNIFISFCWITMLLGLNASFEQICLWLRHDGCLTCGLWSPFFFHIFPVVNSPKVVQWYPKKARDAANFHSIPQGWDVVAFIPSGFSQIISQKVVGSYSHGPMVPWSHNKFPLKTPSFDIPLLSPSISLQANITRLYVIPNHWRHIPVYPHMPIDFPTNIPVIGRFEFTQPSIEGRSPQHPIHIPLISDFGWHFLMDLAQPTKS